VVFALGAERYALGLHEVERIVRAAEVTPLPRAPAVVLGVIEVEGQVLPVFNLRRRFGFPERPIDPDDYFLIAHTASRTVVLVIDAPHGVLERAPDRTIAAAGLTRGIEQIRGVIRLDDGLVLIHDLEALLSAAESRALAQALDADAVHGG
jgi:purine-binding chemotaxis protein CheW